MQLNVMEVYRRLYKHFGPQHWWPTFNKISSFRFHDPRFEICIGAILTQNTAWTNVEKALRNLLAARLMTPRQILKAPSATLRRAIRPAGYFNQKAKKLQALAKFLRFHGLDHGSKAGWETVTFEGLKEMPVLKLREALLGVWGIGRETADSIILYAFQKPIFVIDVYTQRLLEQLGVRFHDYDEYRKFFEGRLPRKVQLWQEYHALIVAWGKLLAQNQHLAKRIIISG